jgi:hypothetical protein
VQQTLRIRHPVYNKPLESDTLCTTNLDNQTPCVQQTLRIRHPVCNKPLESDTMWAKGVCVPLHKNFEAYQVLLNTAKSIGRCVQGFFHQDSWRGGGLSVVIEIRDHQATILQTKYYQGDKSSRGWTCLRQQIPSTPSPKETPIHICWNSARLNIWDVGLLRYHLYTDIASKSADIFKAYWLLARHCGWTRQNVCRFKLTNFQQNKMHWKCWEEIIHRFAYGVTH